MREERRRLTARGLEWRLGSRLQAPTPALALDSSLLLALTHVQTGEMVATAELSLRPRDGRLPAEFAVPPLFLLHSAGLAPYLCNLAVRRGFRRRRIARRLLSSCERLVSSEWQQSELYLHVDLLNQAAAALYRSEGGRPLHRPRSPSAGPARPPPPPGTPLRPRAAAGRPALALPSPSPRRPLHPSPSPPAGYEPLPGFDRAAAASSIALPGRPRALNRYHVKRLPPAPPAAEAGAPPAAEAGAPPAAELGAEAKPATLPAA